MSREKQCFFSKGNWNGSCIINLIFIVLTMESDCRFLKIEINGMALCLKKTTYE